jgi:hypothetical protein
MDPATDPAGFGWIRPDLAKMAGILSDLTGSGRVRPESSNFGQIRPNMLAEIRQLRPDVTGFQRQLHFSPFVILSCEPNTEKYVRKISFFLI